MMLKSTAPIAVVCISIGFAAAMLLMSGGGLTVSADCPDEPGTPCDNGDVNADGSLDIADVIDLLWHLFLGGPEPSPIPCDSFCPAEPGCLATTGQTLCYDTAGAVIDCNNAQYPGQDGFYQNGCPMNNRFVDNGDGTVTDNGTELMWQQATAPGWYTWEGALRYCENLELGEHNDWRLPNIRELQSIVDYGRSSPAIDPVFTAMSKQYWSSSTNVHEPSNAWYMNFIVGSVDAHPDRHGYKTLPGYVRAVRTIQVGE